MIITADIGQTIVQSILYHRYFADPVAESAAASLFDRSTVVLVAVEAVILNVSVLAAASG